MNFEKAYAALLKGKKIRRREWDPYMHLRFIDGDVKTYKGEYTQFYNNAKILISIGWKVLDEEGDYLNFLEALEQLKNKKKLTNLEWIENNQDKFIFIDQNQIVMCTAVEFDFMPTFQCMTSNDWEILN